MQLERLHLVDEFRRQSPYREGSYEQIFFLRCSDTGDISWYKSFGNQQSCVDSVSSLTYLSHLTLNQMVFPAKKYVFKYKTPLPLSICLVVSGTDTALR